MIKVDSTVHFNLYLSIPEHTSFSSHSRLQQSSYFSQSFATASWAILFTKNTVSYVNLSLGCTYHTYSQSNSTLGLGLNRDHVMEII